MLARRIGKAAAIVVAAVSVFAAAGCSVTRSQRDASAANGAALLLDLLNVTSPQSYLDAPSPDGDPGSAADAAFVLIAGHQVVRDMPQIPLPKANPQIALEVVTRELEIYPELRGSRLFLLDPIASLIRYLGSIMVPRLGFRPPSSAMNPVFTYDAYRALLAFRDFASPAEGTEIDRLLSQVRNPQLCQDASLTAAPNRIVNTDANAVLSLASVEGVTCPASAFANLAVGLTSAINAHALRRMTPFTIEELRLVPLLESAGALPATTGDAARADAAQGFTEALALPDAGRSSSDESVVRAAIQALDSDGIAFTPSVALIGNSARLLRWRGGLDITDPTGQAAATAESLWLLRAFAAKTGERSKYQTLLGQIARATDLSALDPQDALVWAAALDLRYTGSAPDRPIANAETLLAVLALWRRGDLDTTTACALARPSGQPVDDTRLPNLLADAIRQAILVGCDTPNLAPRKAALTAALAAYSATEDQLRSPVALGYLAQTACLLGASPRRYAGAIDGEAAGIRAELATSRGLPTTGDLYSADAMYNALLAEDLVSTCSAGWADGLLRK